MNFTTKQIFHIFLFTILTTFLLPITVSANSSSTRNYRTAVSYSSSEPIYPKKGESVTLKNNKVVHRNTNKGILFQGTNSFYLTNGDNTSVVSITNDIATIYEAKEFVNFNLNGSDAQIDTQIVDKNGKAIQPTDPTRNGYIFMGWYTDAEGATKFDFNTPITENITLYAKWVKDNEDKGNIDKENKNIDTSSTELNDKQDNKGMDNPNTGNNNYTILYISLVSISIMAFAGIIIYRKKHSIR